MSMTAFPQLAFDRENMVVSGISQSGIAGILPTSSCSIIALAPPFFGFLAKTGSPAESFLLGGSICINICASEISFQDGERLHTAAECGLTQISTHKTTGIAISEAIASVEAIPVRKIMSANWDLYLCEMVHLQRHAKSTLEERLASLGIVTDQVTSPS